jgi:hypothetical protein
VGIESDRLVYDYLSRVGDVAQQRQLPSATRMRLVTELRGEIDRRRARAMGDSPTTVRRILDRLGSPDAVVAAAGGTLPVQRAAPEAPPAASAPVAPPPAPAPPSSATGQEPLPGGPSGPQPSAPQGSRLWGLRKSVPKQREDDTPPAPAGDWWRVDPVAGPDEVPGFTGGVEIPEMLRPPRERDRDAKAEADAAVPPEPGAVAPVVAPAGRRFAWVPRRGKAVGGGQGLGLGSPVPLAAALLLVAGAVLGHLLPLALGWLIVWGSRRLGPGETRWALVIMPGLAVAGGVVWLWGRARGRWGAPVPDGELAAALAQTGPWVLRTAAVLTAAYVLWRTRRRA